MNALARPGALARPYPAQTVEVTDTCFRTQ